VLNLKYIKLLIFLAVLTSLLLLPLATGSEGQPTQAVQGGSVPTESTPEQSHTQPPISEPEPAEIFPKNMTVLDAAETTPVNIKELPSSDSKSLGIVFGDLMQIDVIKHLDNGYSEVSTWDYKSMKPIHGFVPTKYIKEVKLNEKYGIIVDLGDQKVHIYENDTIVKTFLCSSGLDENSYYTPKGLYRIGGRGESFFSSKYGQGAHYWVRFNNNYLFHSVPFDENQKIIEEEAAKLGQKASHGCIRLSMDDALWFYRNIPQGTPVIIRD
jgi:hypothetical protein